MSEQGTTKDLSRQAENELICEKLLGWQKEPWFDGWCGVWRRPDRATVVGTPVFDSWAESPLILDALVAKGCDWDIESTHTDEGVRATVRVFFPLPNSASVRKRECLGTPFQAIRAAALAYIKAAKP